MLSKDFKIYLKPVILFITGFIFTNFTFGQTTDSVAKSKFYKNFIVGIKLNQFRDAPEIRVSSIFGIEVGKVGKNLSVSYRNFFNVQPVPIDTIVKKNIFRLNSMNVLSLCYKFNLKRSFIQIGIGAFQERRQMFLDQQFLLNRPHYYGVDFSLYVKLKWINVGYRHQIQLFGGNPQYPVEIGVLDLFRYSLCLEIPLKLK